MTEATSSTSDGSIDAVLVRAARLSDLGRPRAAIAVLASALRVDPGHPVAWCRLSAAYLDIGEARESLDAAKRAMTLGEPAWAHRLASLALVELGRHDEAVVSAGEAVRRDPDDWRALVTLSEALAHAEPEQAVRAARAAVDHAPDEARTHEVLGDAAMQAHDWMLAEHAYRDAVHLDPSNQDVIAKLDRVTSRPGDDPRRRRRPVHTRTTLASNGCTAFRGTWPSAGRPCGRRSGCWSCWRPAPWRGSGWASRCSWACWRGAAGRAYPTVPRCHWRCCSQRCQRR